MLGWTRSRLPSAQEIEKQRGWAKYKERVESAMVMVDNVPVGVAWGDPKRDLPSDFFERLGGLSRVRGQAERAAQ